MGFFSDVWDWTKDAFHYSTTGSPRSSGGGGSGSFGESFGSGLGSAAAGFLYSGAERDIAEKDVKFVVDQTIRKMGLGNMVVSGLNEVMREVGYDWVRGEATNSGITKIARMLIEKVTALTKKSLDNFGNGQK